MDLWYIMVYQSTSLLYLSTDSTVHLVTPTSNRLPVTMHDALGLVGGLQGVGTPGSRRLHAIDVLGPEVWNLSQPRKIDPSIPAISSYFHSC